MKVLLDKMPSRFLTAVDACDGCGFIWVGVIGGVAR